VYRVRPRDLRILNAQVSSWKQTPLIIIIPTHVSVKRNEREREREKKTRLSLKAAAESAGPGSNPGRVRPTVSVG
jgi:hypothetical protein